MIFEVSQLGPNIVIFDPVALWVSRFVLLFVFGVAAFHKLSSPPAFVATLRNYRLLPAALTSVVAYLIIGAELVTTLGLAFGQHNAGWLSAALLFIYAGAMALNIIRGRRDIDCGCAGPAQRQPLSRWLVIRNLVLLIPAIIVTQPTMMRTMLVMDWFTVLFCVISVTVLYAAANQLLANRNRALSIQ